MSVVFNRIPGVIAALNQEVADILGTEPGLMMNDIKDAMNQPHSGRIYTRGNVQHQASAPGEAPAIDTGALVNSIQIVRTSPTVVSLQSSQPQALALELGRPEKNLLPRPAWIPSATRAVKRINNRLRRLKARIENV